jgi:hypothetical protein
MPDEVAAVVAAPEAPAAPAPAAEAPPVVNVAPRMKRTGPSSTLPIGSVIPNGAAVQRRSYQTQTTHKTEVPLTATPQVRAEAEAAKEIEAKAAETRAAEPVIEAPVAEPVVESTPAVVTTGAEPTITPGDFAARMARLERRDRKFVQERQAFAAERTKFESERASHAQNLQRVQMVDQGRQLASETPDVFLERVYGIPRHVTRQKILDLSIGDVGRTPEQVAAAQQAAQQTEYAALKSRQDAYDAELKRVAQQAQLDKEAAQVQAYKQTTLAPLIDKFPFVKAEFGDQALEQVYGRLNAVYQRTKVAPNPQLELERAEKVLREKAQRLTPLLGASVTPKQAVPAAKATVPSVPRQADTQSTAAPVVKRRDAPRSYVATKRT